MMKPYPILRALVGTLIMASLTPGAWAATVREPAVAGRFYPSDPAKLRKTVELYLQDAVAPSGERPLALVAPHAGFVFSGQIAADAYNQAAPFDYDLVVLIGAPHTVAGFDGVSIYSGAGYRTPLGTARVDRDVTRTVMAADDRFFYRPAAHKTEHSLEVQIPFVQALFPEARIVAALVGTKAPELCVRFGRVLAEAVADRRVLIVSSTDLSHYPAYDDAVRADRATLDAIRSMTPAVIQDTITGEMRRHTPEMATCACGQAAVMATVSAAAALGADCARIISYANSGDTALGFQRRHRVVGYGAMSFAKTAICRPPPAQTVPQTGSSAQLGHEAKSTLLRLARTVLERIFATDGSGLPLVRTGDPVLFQQRGAFVTLKKKGHLRGCIGHMAEDTPLHQAVTAMTVQAAFNDRRFRPLTVEELPRIEIEISALTPFSEVAGADDIRVGIDGVLLKKDGRSAVFLPQVATEQGWDREQMLDRLCRKAGLSEGDWKAGARFYTFQADVFSESEFASHHPTSRKK